MYYSRQAPLRLNWSFSMVNASSERLHALDAARATALLLGIIFHATMSFLPLNAPMAAVMDNHHSLLSCIRSEWRLPSFSRAFSGT
jgi:hypothetical protein